MAMLEEQGRVVALEDNFAWVRTIRKSSCGQCESKNACSQSVLGKLGTGKSCQILVNNTLDAKLGDDVVLAIPEEALLTASIWVYFLPLILMIAAVVLAKNLFAFSDPMLAVVAVTALTGGFIGASRLGKKHQDDTRFTPAMTKIMPH